MGTEIIKAAELGITALSGGSEAIELLQEALAGEALTLGDMERIKWPTGGTTKFERTVLGNSEMVDAIEGVIVHQGMSRAFWTDPNPTEGTPPDCKSPDAKFGYGSPGDELRAQTPPQGCDVCPNGQFGSSKNPNSPNAQACKLTRDFFMLAKGGGMLPLLVSIPPASLAGGKGYIVELASHGIRYYTVVTRLTLTKEKSKAGQAFAKAELSMVGHLDDESSAGVAEYRELMAPAFRRVVPAAAGGDAVDTTAADDTDKDK